MEQCLDRGSTQINCMGSCGVQQPGHLGDAGYVAELSLGSDTACGDAPGLRQGEQPETCQNYCHQGTAAASGAGNPGGTSTKRAASTPVPPAASKRQRAGTNPAAGKAALPRQQLSLKHFLVAPAHTAKESSTQQKQHQHQMQQQRPKLSEAAVGSLQQPASSSHLPAFQQQTASAPTHGHNSGLVLAAQAPLTGNTLASSGRGTGMFPLQRQEAGAEHESGGGHHLHGVEDDKQVAAAGCRQPPVAPEVQSAVDDHGHATRAAWQRINNSMKPPCCFGHQEPCVIRTVKKKGPNQGRQFWVCARPEGPSPVGRCDHFQFASKARSFKCTNTAGQRNS